MDVAESESDHTDDQNGEPGPSVHVIQVKPEQVLTAVPVTSATADNGVATQQLVDAVQLAVNQLNQETSSGCGEPAAKRARTDSESCEITMDQSIKQILFNINKAICLRLDAIENKLEVVTVRTRYLEDKVDHMATQLKHNSSIVVSQPNAKSTTPNRRGSAVIVGLPQEKSGSSLEDGDAGGLPGLDQSLQTLGPNVTLITLNTEEDFPHGCWLGDETNPEMRVRVPVTPSDLLHIHSNCRTPEKMALTLLDYLFDRDTQASSNLSGMGKHGKKQLDPLMIYGIRCHLIHRFAITEQDWHRIKQNIDSKCRTAYRRKVRGQPLTVKAFRGKAPPTYVHMGTGNSPHMGHDLSDDSLTHDDAELRIHQGEVDLSHAGILGPGTTTEIIQTAGGEIQVLHATPEQVAQLQQAHQIQILQGEAAAQVMQLQQADGQDIHVAVSLPSQPEGIVINQDGETIHINPTGDGVGVSEEPVVEQVEPTVSDA